ncbi:MAG: VanZ family protein [bacterium]
MVFSKHRVFYWLLVLGYCGVIFYFSSRPALSITHDKIAHLTEYSLLGFFVAAAIKHYFQPRPLFLILITVGLGTLYGVSDEFHQYFVPGRECSVWDALADLTGSFLGACLYVTYSRLQKPSPANS